ncbi:hypothetical protein NPIL_443161 [Nephila pilipes]|uniref:Uncharacterized protein n=1 Tax=Nephila pilipes TaxID=299642 RepID=A0A8X6NLW8_NEPPI|nr:hypothetical protein NPIL_443161 [Nephila pilipes]
MCTLKTRNSGSQNMGFENTGSNHPVNNESSCSVMDGTTDRPVLTSAIADDKNIPYMLPHHKKHAPTSMRPPEIRNNNSIGGSKCSH